MANLCGCGNDTDNDRDNDNDNDKDSGDSRDRDRDGDTVTQYMVGDMNKDQSLVCSGGRCMVVWELGELGSASCDHKVQGQVGFGSGHLSFHCIRVKKLCKSPGLIGLHVCCHQLQWLNATLTLTLTLAARSSVTIPSPPTPPHPAQHLLLILLVQCVCSSSTDETNTFLPYL